MDVDVDSATFKDWPLLEAQLSLASELKGFTQYESKLLLVGTFWCSNQGLINFQGAVEPLFGQPPGSRCFQDWNWSHRGFPNMRSGWACRACSNSLFASISWKWRYHVFFISLDIWLRYCINIHYDILNTVNTIQCKYINLYKTHLYIYIYDQVPLTGVLSPHNFWPTKVTGLKLLLSLFSQRDLQFGIFGRLQGLPQSFDPGTCHRVLIQDRSLAVWLRQYYFSMENLRFHQVSSCFIF